MFCPKYLFELSKVLWIFEAKSYEITKHFIVSHSSIKLFDKNDLVKYVSFFCGSDVVLNI